MNWAKLFKPDEKYSRYSLELVPDEAGDLEYKKTGLQLKRRANGGLSFGRPIEKLIKGELVEFGPPKVVDVNGEPLSDKIMFANGCKATIKVVVYKTPKGPGHRLEAVRVDELLEYVPDGGSSKENF